MIGMMVLDDRKIPLGEKINQAVEKYKQTTKVVIRSGAGAADLQGVRVPVVEAEYIHHADLIWLVTEE